MLSIRITIIPDYRVRKQKRTAERLPKIPPTKHKESPTLRGFLIEIQGERNGELFVCRHTASPCRFLLLVIVLYYARFPAMLQFHDCMYV